MALLETQNLTKIYGNKMIAVNGINLSIEKGWVFGLLGPNGAGKTTLVKLLLGLQKPTAGTAQLFGKRVTPNSADIRSRIGYLPTNPKFPPTMTPITYLDLLGRLFGMSREERMPRLSGLIRAVDLLPAASRPIKSFSTGMTTRLGIAASLMNDPDLLIWDEPTAGLDPAGRKYTLDLLRELGKTKTIIVSSHILTDIDRVCDHVGILHQGKFHHHLLKKFKEFRVGDPVFIPGRALPFQQDGFLVFKVGLHEMAEGFEKTLDVVALQTGPVRPAKVVQIPDHLLVLLVNQRDARGHVFLIPTYEIQPAVIRLGDFRGRLID